MKDNLENALLTILIGISSFTASYLKDLSSAVDSINSQVILVLDRVNVVTEISKDQEARLRIMELKR